MNLNPVRLGYHPAASADSTDPLAPLGGFEERVTPLRAGGSAVLEQVEVWGNGARSDAFLRLSIERDGPEVQALRSLLLALPEAQTGFRDLLLRPGFALAASFTLPDASLAQFAMNQPGNGDRGVVRPRCLISGVAALAAMLAEVEAQSGYGWARPDGALVGLRRSQPFKPAGYALWQLQFTGWDALTPGTPTDAAALAGLLAAPLAWLAALAANSGEACSQTRLALEELREAVRSLNETAGLTLAGLAAALRGLLPRGFALHGATDVGQRRQHNEDAYLLLEQQQCSAFGAQYLLAAVADGMGGHSSGEVASSLALDLLRLQLAQLALPPRSRSVRSDGLGDDLRAVVQGTGRALLERSSLDAAQAGMGTTLVGLAGLAPHSTLDAAEAAPLACCVFNIGDSRAYLLGAHGLARLSTDHSHVQELVDSGQLDADDAFTHPQKNIITRCLGGGGKSEPLPDVFAFAPGPAEIVLLCSDGLSDALRDREIAAVCAAVPCPGPADRAYLAALARALIAAANAAGGPDNITVVLAAAAGAR
jgi:protein phosphatase